MRTPSAFDFKVCCRPGCNKAFIPNRRWQKYCCQTCNQMAFYLRRAASESQADIDYLLHPNAGPTNAGPTPAEEAEWKRRADEAIADRKTVDQKTAEIIQEAQKLMGNPKSPLEEWLEQEMIPETKTPETKSEDQT